MYEPVRAAPVGLFRLQVVPIIVPIGLELAGLLLHRLKHRVLAFTPMNQAF
jgi:hypothetical protein